MSKQVFIDDLSLMVSDFVVENVASEPTGNILRKVVFTTTIIGLSTKETIEKIINKCTFYFHVPDEIDVIKVKKENETWSYTGTVLDENTTITYKIELVEHDKDLPEDWNMLAMQHHTNIMNWIRTRALSELLIEKGLITMPEYEAKINLVSERDFDNLHNYIVYGLLETKIKEE